MKLVFIDVDGVLATPKSYKTDCFIKATPTERNPVPEDKQYNSFCPKAVANLNHVLRTTSAKMIVSSTWRKLYELPELVEIFKREGVEGVILVLLPKELEMAEEAKKSVSPSRTFRQTRDTSL